ncbi:Protein RIK [Striga hermonthica]|uniref:Protein RIK n=1 Tax=Striga hermonthica TaxID=68872 RepID=A0A9N7RG21_STRHE|nr:Protein RIK [Striga hermonthica]
MTEDCCNRVSSSESDPSTAKQSRKKRKWDQPDEAVVSAGVAVPGVFPLASVGSLARVTLPVGPSAIGASLAIPLSDTSATSLQAFQVPLPQHAAAIVQKLIQPKIQDELIAREIVINDADSAIRYKLTKRQTQEEIQKSTSALVITRGKYRPPNAPPDAERPLYLHISAAAHLETTAERIKAVDRAAAMVEEMLKTATVSSGVKVDHSLSTCVFLGFQPDPSLDIISRIRGPNDQYVNHIMNETGATVLIRGRGSGFPENGQTEETQPLHLLLSSNNAKSLEHAKLLAENLLDTICGECGASRISSCKVYGAVPPPPQLQAGIQIPANAPKANDVAAINSTSLGGVNSIPSRAQLSQSLGMSNPILRQEKAAYYPQGLTSVTSYNGYGGIYPQATPLQQVALALRQSASPVTATVAPTTIAVSKDPQMKVPSHSRDKRSQKRKFQELPAAAKGPEILNQNNFGACFEVGSSLPCSVHEAL